MLTLYVNRASAPAREVVKLHELAEVRAHHLPTAQVQLAPLAELHRRAAEISRQHPHLGEEARFVVADETGRRRRLAGPALTVSQ